jgi:hypothetical protein
VSTAGEMARADEAREQAAAERAARERKERNEQEARLAGAKHAIAKLPLAKADLITGLEVQLEATRKAQERLALFLQGQEAIEGALADARLEETQALSGKGISVAERAKRITDSRSLQSVYQADLDNHGRGKEDIVVELRDELAALNRWYSPLFGRELGARIEAKKRELARTLDAETIAHVQAGIGYTSIGTPVADALEHMAKSSKPVQSFYAHKSEWPLDFERSGPAHLAHPRVLASWAQQQISGVEYLLANLSKET